VGAHGNDDAGSSSGSAYIFKKNGDTWIQAAKLRAGDGASGDYFGKSVSISGDSVVVGASGDDDYGSSSGSAYIFKKEGDTWTQAAKLRAGDGAHYDEFGNSVSISGDTVVVGAIYDDNASYNSGSAYIFKKEGDTWTQVAKIIAGDGASYDEFGNSVSISESTVVVGAQRDDDAGSSSGSAYIGTVNP
ncbi:MAG: hypothetical protein GY699_06550, partial [Desulfobacteraceae bacterium]|nr:hypothetical protein [Desulfobacteraceae bacterium]